MTKNKIEELLNEKQGFLLDLIEEVAPGRKIDVTEHQLARLEKKIKENIIDDLLTAIENKLLAEESIEFKGQFNVFPYTSTVAKNENGKFKKKVSVCTRTSLHRKLNN